MRTQSRVAVGLLGLAVLLVSPGAVARAQAQKTPVEMIRKELLQLPYYGVFDFLAVGYDKGAVTLVGYAYRPTLKDDAERAVKRAPGVDTVINTIEVLPVSPMDDELRWKTYYAIYGDPFLSRYAPGGGMLWGHRHGFGAGGLGRFGPAEFPGMEPAGDYPIHIIVKNGKIKLMGVVDNESDKTMAGMKASQVPGAFGVENDLMVDSEKSTKKD
jgi:hyperosmotically inducible protein